MRQILANKWRMSSEVNGEGVNAKDADISVIHNRKRDKDIFPIWNSMRNYLLHESKVVRLVRV